MIFSQTHLDNLNGNNTDLDKFVNVLSIIAVKGNLKSLIGLILNDNDLIEFNSKQSEFHRLGFNKILSFSGLKYQL